MAITAINTAITAINIATNNVHGHRSKFKLTKPSPMTLNSH